MKLWQWQIDCHQPTSGTIRRKDNGYSVIIEGILGEPRYGAMLRGLAEA